MYSKFGQFIDGKWQQSQSKETYDVINPATEELVGKASKASSKDVDNALRSAQKGFLVWKKLTKNFNIKHILLTILKETSNHLIRGYSIST